MSAFTKIAFPMFCVAFTMLYLARKKRDKNYLTPGFLLLAAGFLSAVVGLTTG